MYTWTPKVCRIIALLAVYSGFGPFFTYFGGPGIHNPPEVDGIWGM